jgi:peptidoglycan/xylan/chitin deacetylase (PgdA/CDA1 family)
LRRKARACIVLYHRVNDTSVDVLTTSRRRFAEHLLAMRRYYTVRPSSWLVEQLRTGGFIQPTTLVIHFDDSYADVYEAAGPLLHAAGLPAASFISSGYLDTDRTFPHDEGSLPHRMRNMTAEQVRLLPSRGIEVGAHTVNHVDMARLSAAEARRELRESKEALERITGHGVALFSFPYGRPEHFNPDMRQLALEAGYNGIFSAFGGFIRRTTDPCAIPRVSAADESHPLYLLLQIEGLAFWQVRDYFRQAAARE